jgi:hypothetical protein
MPEKALLRQIQYFWLGVAGGLTVLAFCASSKLLPASIVTTLRAILVLTIPIAELFILKQAAHRFSELLQPQGSGTIFSSPRSIAWRRRNLKFLIGLFVFCLPFGLLAGGSEPQALLPEIIGVTVNLGITYFWAISLFRLRGQIASR